MLTILVVAVIVVGALFLDAVTSGNLDAGFFIFLFPIIIPMAGLFYGILSLLPFVLLRRWAPARGIGRFAYVVFFLAPIIAAFDVVELFVLKALHFFQSSAREDTFSNWTATGLITAIGGVVCWGIDRRAALFSADRSVRWRARLLVAGVLGTIVLVGIVFQTCNQFLVVYRAEHIAGDRPYCIVISDHEHVYSYLTPTERSQLSSGNMRAGYMLAPGQRGGFWGTNHALMKIEGVPDYLHWSYRSEDFIDGQAVIFGAHCSPIAHFAKTLR